MGDRCLAPSKTSGIFRQEVKPMVKFDDDENGGDADFEDDNVEDSGDEN